MLSYQGLGSLKQMIPVGCSVEQSSRAKVTHWMNCGATVWHNLSLMVCILITVYQLHRHIRHKTLLLTEGQEIIVLLEQHGL